MTYIHAPSMIEIGFSRHKKFGLFASFELSFICQSHVIIGLILWRKFRYLGSVPWFTGFIFNNCLLRWRQTLSPFSKLLLVSSCFLFSMASKILYCMASCFCMTCFIRPSKNSIILPVVLWPPLDDCLLRLRLVPAMLDGSSLSSSSSSSSSWKPWE